MKFLADENCGATLIAALGAAGHEDKAVARTDPGILDDAVFALARREDRILLTNDTGFGHIAELAAERPPAVVLMRLRGTRSAPRARIVAQAVAELGPSLPGHFVVIGPASVRKRPYKD